MHTQTLSVGQKVTHQDGGAVRYDVIRLDRGLVGVRPSDSPGVTPLAWALPEELTPIE